MSLSLAALAVLSLLAGGAILLVMARRPPAWLRQPLKIGESEHPRTILVTGATGFIGRRLCRALLAGGDQVIVLTRRPGRARALFGPHVQVVEALGSLPRTTRIDGIVNLAGASIAGAPWTARRRRTLLASRTGTTRALAALAARLDTPPAVLVNASAVGFYGAAGRGVRVETDPSGNDFQAALCRTWENEAEALSRHGSRVCMLRLGIVLGAGGGVLPRLALPMRFGLAVSFGRGDHWVPFIHLDDAVGLMVRALSNPAFVGPVNAVAPTHASHARLIDALAGHHRTFARIVVPGWLLRRLLGELASLFVDGTRVSARRAEALGYDFAYPDLEGAIAAEYGRAGAEGTLEIFFDGACPVCRAEIGHYRTAGRRAGADVGFTDMAASGGQVAALGLDTETARRRMYVRHATGQVESGIDAFIAIWKRLPGYRRFARIAALPGLYHLLDVGYDLIAAPLVAAWSRRRRARCAAGAAGTDPSS